MLSTNRAGVNESSTPYGIIATDLNNDGYVDITSVNEITADLRVFLNTGDGSGRFQSMLNPFPVDFRASPSEPADFNRDGFADIAVANIGTGSNLSSVSILLGNGDGTYRPQQKINVGVEPRGLVVLDVDGDGDIDIVNTNRGDSNVAILKNNGSGVFGTPSYVEGGGNGEFGLNAADMNQDGILDLVVGAHDSQTMVVAIGDGAGGYTPGTGRPLSGKPWQVAVGDLNGDGREDVASVNGRTSGVTGELLMGDGRGGLSAPESYGIDSFGLASDLGDIDGDGDLDWLTSSYFGDWRLFVNDGHAEFTYNQSFGRNVQPNHQAASCAAAADVDNDGDLDLILIDEEADELVILKNTSTPFQSVSLSATTAVRNEGQVGSTILTFTLTRSGDATAASSVHYAVAGSGSNPAAPSDFGGAYPSGIVRFSAGETTQTISVLVSGDSEFEADETFLLTLSAPSVRLSLGTSSAIGTILNDDSPPNVAPVIESFDTPVSYTEDSAPVILDDNVVLVDSDSLNFETGTINVRISQNARPGDRIAIRNQGTGLRLVGVSGAVVSFSGVPVGTITRSGGDDTSLVVTLNRSATRDAAESILRNLIFSNSSSAPEILARTITVQVSDGDGGISNQPSKTVTVVAVNDPPTLSGSTSVLTYFSGGARLFIAADAVVRDPDTSNLSAAVLTARLASGGSVLDRLRIQHQGTGPGLVGVSGALISFGDIRVATMAGGTGEDPLTVRFNASATLEAATAVLRNLVFYSISTNPGDQTRTVEMTMNDGQGGSSNPLSRQILVKSTNVPPSVTGFDTLVTYVEGAVPAILDTNAVVTDPDSANFATGQLTAAFASGGTSLDRLSVRNQGTAAGQIGVNGTSITWGGVTIGTFNGGIGATPLRISFNSAAGLTAVQAVIRNLTYQYSGDNPGPEPKTVSITLSDGDGGTSNQPSKSIRVTPTNDAPVINGFDTPVTYTIGSLPVPLDTNATITDPDSMNFSGGRLTVQLVTGFSAQDRLTIRNQGTQIGRVGVTGSTVTYGGVAVGTFSGGTGGTALLIVLNPAATPTAVQAVLRNVAFHFVGNTADANLRTVRATVTDGDGGTSMPVQKSVRLVRRNEGPTIAGFNPPINYRSGGAAILVDTDVTVVDPDSPNFENGVLTFALTGGESTDLLAIRNQGTAAGLIDISGSTVTWGGLAIGTFSGGSGLTPLTVRLNIRSTAASVQALMRNVTFRNVSATPVLRTRNIRVTLTDGDGGLSNGPVKQILFS
ncbi:MAG: FG-GAP-like repeat-containing protein [Planctomyces sp.]